MNMDYELLAKETLELSHILRKQKQLLDEIDPSMGMKEEKSEEDWRTFDYNDPEVSEGPGIIFRIENAGHTFCIRGFATTNLKFRHGQIKNHRDEEASKKLKINFQLENHAIHFFETDSVEKADKIVKHMINRRYPIQEDLICNLSDPGFSWWYDDAGDRITVFFKSHGIDRATKLTQLGPIGDNRKAGIYFNQVFKLYGLLFPVKEFSCTSKSLTISTHDQYSDTFRMFRRVFLEGVNEFELDYPFNSPIFCEFWYYLEQIASFRKFWLFVNDLLEAEEQNSQEYLQ